jgi:hypothetical protein
LLFDDVIWTRRARKEFDAFVDLMRWRGVEVPALHELLSETLDEPAARHWLLSRGLRPEEVTALFSLDTFNDRTFILCSLLSAGSIILATEFGFFQRILDTVELTGNQWLICIGAGLTVLVASEIRKFFLRRQT